MPSRCVRVALAVLATLLAASPASALVAKPSQAGARSGIPPLPETEASTNFLVHYTTQGEHAIDAATAKLLAADAQRGREVLIGLGLPAPLDDGDGKSDVYVYKLPVAGDPNGFARPDSSAAQSSGAIHMNTFAAGNGSTVAHEYFHLVQFGLYRPEARWLLESSATWAGYHVTGQVKRLGILRSPEVSLACTGVDAAACGNDPFGYQRWLFWQSLADRFGAGVIGDVFRSAATLGAGNNQPHTLQAIDAALASRSTNLSSAFLEYANTAASGAFAHAELKGVTPVANASVTTGAVGTTGASPIVLDRLAGRYVTFTGSGAACQPATLRLRVAAPAGVPFEPTFDIFGDGRGPYRLPVKTGNATENTIPWATCPNAQGKLGVTNASTTADQVTFGVDYAVVAPPAAARPPAAPPAPPKSAPRTAAPEITAFTLPVSFKVKRRRAGRLKVVLTATRAGRAQLIFDKRAGSLSCRPKGSGQVIEVGTTTTTKIVRLRAGVNRITLETVRQAPAGRNRLVVVPFSADEEVGECVTKTTKLIRRR